MGQKIENKLTGILNPTVKWITENLKILIILVLVIVIGLIIYKLLVKEMFSTSNTVEFELVEPIISVTDIDRIKIKLKYKKIASNKDTIYYDLKKEGTNSNFKFYPRNEPGRKRLSIIYQDIPPDPEKNMVDNQVVDKTGTKSSANGVGSLA